MSPLTLGLVLALTASVALNLSYLLQHSGSGSAPAITPLRPLASLRSLLASRLWVVGALVGLGGWALHVDALRHAPLSLVQAFVAGGLVLAVPLAVALGHRVDRGERGAMAALAGSLVLLTLGAGHRGAGPLHPLPLLSGLGAAALLSAVVAALPARGRRGPALGLAGGILYGAADMAIKAATEAGSGSAIVPWIALAGLLTLGAFFSFQRALQIGSALPVIAVMTSATNVVSIAGGLLALGDRLGTTPLLAGLHAAAFVLVVVAGWRLAPAQAALAVGGPPR